tara:strand:- start:1080 stop:2045 length:966 start_codon:yes stop_codon:yes gene_type:complete
MIKILVSGVGGDVAQGVIKCLQQSKLKTKIYKIASSVEESWLHVDENCYLSPRVDSKEYLDYLYDFILQHKIDVFIPCVDSEIYKISLFANKIHNITKCKVIVGDIDKIKICEDKFKTYEFLKDNDFCYPETFLSKEDKKINFPSILKTRSGSGSKNIYEICNKDQLKSHIFEDNMILQEKLEGDEYTAGVYLGKDKQIKGVCIFKRKLKNGSTNFAERIIDKNIELYICKIAKKLDLTYVNIQFKLKNNLPCPFEFNGRFSGTTGFISKVFNAPDLWLRENFLNQKIEKQSNLDKFYVMRYAEEIYATQEEMINLIERSK